jgi:hypothetical protein
MTQDGRAGRDQYNVSHGNVTVNQLLAQKPESSPRKPISPEAGGGGGGGGVVVIVLLLVAIVFFFQSSLQEPFPAKCDAWPKGARKNVLLERVVHWIGVCAKTVMAEPANCPQSLDETLSSDIKIEWSLYGSPIDGAQVCFRKSDRLFHVLGGTVMVARYGDSETTALKVVPLYYWAKLKWRGKGVADVEKIDAYNGTPRPPITKEDPGVPWKDLARAVRKAFTRCASVTSALMPTGCPVSTTLPFEGEQVSWTIDTDPTATARPSFDAQHGVIHVKGSYSMTAHSKTSGEHMTQTQKGNYDASVIADASTLIVLEIAKTS